jgi:hypothetical protein
MMQKRKQLDDQSENSANAFQRTKSISLKLFGKFYLLRLFADEKKNYSKMP